MPGIATFFLILGGASALTPPSFNCLIEPQLRLEAGNTTLTDVVAKPMGRQCEATMYFVDPSYLPMTFTFNSTSCDTTQVNSFKVPKFAPNGEVDLIWRCNNMDSSCRHAEIWGGSVDMAVPRHMYGQVGCLQETVRTITTLVTATKASGTLTSTFPTVLTTTKTSMITTVSPTPRKSRQGSTTLRGRTTTTTVKLPTHTTQTSKETSEVADVTATEKSAKSLASTFVEGPTVTALADRNSESRAAKSEITSSVEEDSASQSTQTVRTKSPDALQSDTETSQVASDSVFLSSGSRILPAVTMSIVTTITATVTRTM